MLKVALCIDTRVGMSPGLCTQDSARTVGYNADAPKAGSF